MFCMTFKHQVGACTKPRSFKTPTEYVWISDDFLHRELQRFILSGVSRRHGSFVPGPLEARRRAAKRRMMNLAEVGGGSGRDGDTIDPSFLTGSHSGQSPWDWQWQSPKVPVQQPIQEVKKEILELPSWLTDHIPEEDGKNDPLPPKPRGNSLRTFLARQSTNIKKEPTFMLNNKLVACNCLRDIRKLLIESQVNMQISPACSRLAFRRLLQTKPKIRPVLQFLEDPSLNNPKAQNIQTFLRWYAARSTVNLPCVRIVAWLRRQISLGCLIGEELLVLIQTLSDLRQTLGTKFHDLSLPLAVSESLNTSTVVQIQDIKAITLNLLLGLMAYGHPSPEMKLSGIKIIQSLHEPQLQLMKRGISSFLRSYLLAETLDEQKRTKRIDEISTILILLQRLPKDIMISITTEVSRELIGCVKSTSVDRSNSVEAFDAWCSSLINHDIFKVLKHDESWHEFERHLMERDIDIVGLYLQNFTNDEKKLLIHRAWFNPTKSANGMYYPLVAAEIEEWFNPLVGYSSIQHTFTAMFRVLGTRITTSADFSSLLQTIDKLGMDRTILSLIHCFQECGIHIDHQIIIKQIRKHAKTFPHIAYYLFKRTLDLPLESCPAIAEIMIYNARFNPSTALSYSYQRRGFLQVFHDQAESHHKIRQARIELFGRMAIAYANAPHLFPRVAFRQVYICYLLHRQYKLGPLSVEISSALTISGIARPLQESKWTGTQKVAWILEIVSEVEGDAVATRVDELVYTWRGLVHRDLERKRFQAWRLGELGFFNYTGVEGEKRERQRRFYRGPFSREWKMWGKTKDESWIRRVLWGLDTANTHPANHANDTQSPTDSFSPTSSSSSFNSATDFNELDGILSSDIVLWREMERYKARR